MLRAISTLTKQYIDKETGKVLFLKVNRFKGKGVRLVHDGKRVLCFFDEDKGITETRHSLVVGGLEECRQLIETLKLQYTPDDEAEWQETMKGRA